MIYKNEQFDRERALYGICGATVDGCAFEGEGDGESALKECKDITVRSSRFALRYPLWHTENARLTDCVMTEACRAPLWYAKGIVAEGLRLTGVKAVRECVDVTVTGSHMESEEFGWLSRDIRIADSELSGAYAFFHSKGLILDGVRFSGKYSFQYVENAEIRNCVLKTKDAFWHAKNVRVYDSVVDGEYLGWYSENLHLVRCRITGTQPLCYAKGLILEDCVMEGTDLAFEKSEVEASVKGKILSIKAPASGRIVCDGYGEVLMEDNGQAGNAQIIVRENG